MSISPAKENILKKIRQALSHPVPVPFPHSEGNSSVFQPPVDDMAVQFAQEFTALQGKFAFCADEQDMADQLLQLAATRKWDKVVCREQKLIDIFKQQKLSINFHESLSDCDVSFTTCELLVSRTGTMVLSTANESGRTTSVYAPVHVCIAYASQLVYDLKDALLALREKYNGQLHRSSALQQAPAAQPILRKHWWWVCMAQKKYLCF